LQIDWLTVAAQIVNFLILVWLLRRFLYRPITEAMRKRESKIETRLADARNARNEAEEEAERLSKERAELEDEKSDMLESARAEAAELRSRLENELRDEMEEKRAAWKRHLAEEREEFARTLQRRAGHQLLDIAGRVLADFADADLAERVAAAFVARLENIDEDEKERLADAAARADAAVIETGRALDEKTRKQVTEALHGTLSTDLPVRYEEDPDVLLGVRLTIGEQSVEWSAAHHMKRLETVLDEILESARQERPDSSAEEEEVKDEEDHRDEEKDSEDEAEAPREGRADEGRA
jgi:F-type H+-transporting ATPase subunit b